MSIKLGNTVIGSMYLGSTKIGSAYLGSTLVYASAVPGNYDSYKIHMTWDDPSTFNMAGLKINGVQATTSQVTSIWYYYNGWYEYDDVPGVIEWGDEGSTGHKPYGYAIDINFTSSEPVQEVQIHTGRWYGGNSMTVTMHLAGVKNDVETDLGYTSAYNTNDLIYTITV